MKRTLTAVLQHEDGVWIAECVEIGTAGHGLDVEAALASLARSTENYLRTNPPPASTRTLLTTFEVEVAEPGS